MLNTINLYYNYCSSAGLQNPPAPSISKQRRRKQANEEFSLTCTNSLLGSWDKQWRTQPDLTVKQTDMDHLKLQWALPAYSATTTPTTPHSLLCFQSIKFCVFFSLQMAVIISFQILQVNNTLYSAVHNCQIIIFCYLQHSFTFIFMLTKFIGKTKEQTQTS